MPYKLISQAIRLKSCGKLIVTNFTLSDIKSIENRQVSRAQFMNNLFSIFGWVDRCFFLGNQPLNFTQNWLPDKLSGHLGRPDDR